MNRVEREKKRYTEWRIKLQEQTIIARIIIVVVIIEKIIEFAIQSRFGVNVLFSWQHPVGAICL